MSKKRLVSVLVLVLLLTPLLTVAQAESEEKSSCSGFWGSISCFLWGNPENRAGKGWFDRGALAGKAAAEAVTLTEVRIIKSGKSYPVVTAQGQLKSYKDNNDNYYWVAKKGDTQVVYKQSISGMEKVGERKGTLDINTNTIVTGKPLEEWPMQFPETVKIPDDKGQQWGDVTNLPEPIVIVIESKRAPPPAAPAQQVATPTPVPKAAPEKIKPKDYTANDAYLVGEFTDSKSNKQIIYTDVLGRLYDAEGNYVSDKTLLKTVAEPGSGYDTAMQKALAAQKPAAVPQEISPTAEAKKPMPLPKAVSKPPEKIKPKDYTANDAFFVGEFLDSKGNKQSIYTDAQGLLFDAEGKYVSDQTLLKKAAEPGSGYDTAMQKALAAQKPAAVPQEISQKDLEELLATETEFNAAAVQFDEDQEKAKKAVEKTLATTKAVIDSLEQKKRTDAENEQFAKLIQSQQELEDIQLDLEKKGREEVQKAATVAKLQQLGSAVSAVAQQMEKNALQEEVKKVEAETDDLQSAFESLDRQQKIDELNQKKIELESELDGIKEKEMQTQLEVAVEEVAATAPVPSPLQFVGQLNDKNVFYDPKKQKLFSEDGNKNIELDAADIAKLRPGEVSATADFVFEVREKRIYWYDDDKLWDSQGNEVEGIQYSGVSGVFEKKEGYEWAEGLNVKRITPTPYLSGWQCQERECTCTVSEGCFGTDGKIIPQPIALGGTQIPQESAAIKGPSVKFSYEVQQILGKDYENYKNLIDWGESNKEEDGTTLIALNVGGSITSHTDKTGLTTIIYDLEKVVDEEKVPDNEKSTTVFRQGSVELARQGVSQKEQKTIQVDGSVIYIGEELAAGSLTKGLTYYATQEEKEKDKPLGQLQLSQSLITNTNFKTLTQTVTNTLTKEKSEREGDYYQNGKGGCKEKNGCFVATGGTRTLPDNRQQLEKFDLEGSEATRTVKEIELFNAVTGNFEGVETTKDGTREIITANVDTQGKYTGEFTITTISPKQDKTEKTVKTVKQDCAGCTESQKENVQNVYTLSQGWVVSARAGLQTVYAVTQSVKSYPALSNFLFQDFNWYQDWKRTSDESFAPLLGSNWFPSTICESHYDIEPEGVGMIKTVSGTYQAVASIQIERSEKPSPTLCEQNPDEEAEEPSICARQLQCREDQFCYKGGAETPEQAYFYKVTWGVTAPRDETLTPLIDENGVAVSFNVLLYPEDGSSSIPIYNYQGDTAGPIQLKNGEGDRDLIIQYSPKEYSKACIKWNQAPNTQPTFGFGSDPIPDVCFDTDISSVGQVNWKNAGKPGSGGSVRVSSGQVGRNTDW
ncbi:hypothetical protein HYX14_05665 [Candidatus Woesearchaeota archaeon]|nr:hypothetical protein [Candidatus Woesearchaeota archaeon]